MISFTGKTRRAGCRGTEESAGCSCWCLVGKPVHSGGTNKGTGRARTLVALYNSSLDGGPKVKGPLRQVTARVTVH